LVQIETANILLLGWIQLDTHRSSERVDYNTRASWAMDKFIVAVKRRWLGEATATDSLSPQLFGAELDIKFRNLLHFELDRNEVVLAQCFTPPFKYEKRFLGLTKVHWRPGHLVVLTSGNRLVWLKDDYRGRWERYAGIAVSAPISLFQSARVDAGPGYRELVIDFRLGTSWRISMFGAGSGWADFSDALNRWFVSVCGPAQKEWEPRHI
jgi:hypothetical protein